MDRRDNFKKGSIEMLALKILSEKDCYGYELCQLMKERSGGVIAVPEGSLGREQRRGKSDCLRGRYRNWNFRGESETFV